MKDVIDRVVDELAGDVVEARGKQNLVATIISVRYRRNGITGTPFWLVEFVDNEGMLLLGIVFDKLKTVAVINPTNLANAFRGDDYEAELRVAIEDAQGR